MTGKSHPSVDQLSTEAHELLRSCATLDALEECRVALLGRKGAITSALRTVADLKETERAAIGHQLNALKHDIEERIAQQERDIKRAQLHQTLLQSKIDISLPGKPLRYGRIHPLTVVMSEIVGIFMQMGFILSEGPEIETDYYNFAALNFPEDHPARDTQDTFFLDLKAGTEGPVILRTHTSPVQIRLMKSAPPPLRALMPGRVYRHEAVDATHSAVFHQVEGLAVDTAITFSDLKGMLELFVHSMFGKAIKLRFRPSFFPFTEPSAEVDIECFFCRTSGCPVCKQSGWLEMLGAGMVHPNVFRAVGYDPEKLSGFAFGIGVERVTMLRYGINDMRLLYDNDMRFLETFV
jgi:phenylalanyl-tRNA synthetase alpha chain